MRATFDHEELRVYQAAIDLVAWHEEVSPEFTGKASAYDHFARACAGVPVNIAQASGKRSMSERCQFVDTAYGSSLECAACLDVLCILGCLMFTPYGRRRAGRLQSRVRTTSPILCACS